MKRKIRLISAVLLFATLISSVAMLASCGTVGDAMLWQKLDERMNSLSSYKSEFNMQMVFYVDEKLVRSSGEGVQIESKGDTPEDYYYYQSIKSTVNSTELGIDETVRNIEAYNEGSYYVYQRDFGGKTSRIYGEMAAEDFQSFIEKRGSMGIDVTKAGKVKRSREKGGLRSVEYSEFSEYDVKRAMQSFGMNESIFGFGVKDIVLKVTYDRKYRVSTMDYAFVFDVYDKAKNKPAAVVRVEYSDYDSAQRDYTNIDPKYYTKLNNIKVLTDIYLELDRLKKASEGEFDLNVAQYMDHTPSQNWLIENDKVRYGYRDGKFYYDIETDMQGNSFKVSYSDGEQAVKIGSTTHRNEQTESEARAFIDSLIDSPRFVMSNVIGIGTAPVEDNGVDDVDEVYVIEVEDLDPSVYQEIAASFGVSQYVSVKHKITANYYNGKLVILISEMEIRVDQMNAIHVNTKTTFKD